MDRSRLQDARSVRNLSARQADRTLVLFPEVRRGLRTFAHKLFVLNDDQSTFRFSKRLKSLKTHGMRKQRPSISVSETGPALVGIPRDRHQCSRAQGTLATTVFADGEPLILVEVILLLPVHLDTLHTQYKVRLSVGRSKLVKSCTPIKSGVWGLT